ncbi:MAG: peptidase [Lachnospiraceae bacterium]|nr:peptidase [Lachnospiraceae bacterium]
MNTKLERGARIITEQWLELHSGERLFIVTSEEYKREMKLIEQYAKDGGTLTEMMIFPKQPGQVGHYFDVHEDAFDSFDVILGATMHSLVTTKAAKRAIERGSRFLSLPLSTNDGRSLLEYDFLQMDPKESKRMADKLLERLSGGKRLKVTTAAGTNLTFSMEGREAQLFTGATRQGKGYSSSSFEIFIPIVENETFGTGVVDASLGYIGVPKEPVKIGLKEGRVCEIEQNETGQKLSQYMADFHDEGMYVAGEFGIGLNTFSKCRGNSYIEDESAYGTFHIGFGRNIGFGGKHEAKAHFDLVFDQPDIYVDDILIMEKGEVIWDEETLIAL